jgi:hypothetical protein
MMVAFIDDHRGHHVHLGTRPAAQQTPEAEPLHRRHDGMRIAMREGPDHLELVGWDQRFFAKAAANQVDDVRGQVGQIPDRLVAHLPALAVTAPQEMRLVGLAVVAPGRGDDVYRASPPRQAGNTCASPGELNSISDYILHQIKGQNHRDSGRRIISSDDE